MSYLLSWLLVILALLIAFTFRKVHRSWLAPGAFFALVWSGYILLPLIFTPRNYISPLPILWITFFIFVIGFGSHIGIALQSKYKNEVQYFSLSKTKLIIYLCMIMSLLNTMILLRTTGQGLSVFFSLNTLSDLAGDFAYAKYHEGLQLPAIYSLINVFSFIGAIISGFYWALKREKIAFLIFLPAVLNSMITTTKGGVLYLLVLWLGGWLSAKVYNGNLKLITFKLFYKMFILGFLLFGFFVLLNMFRYGIDSNSGNMSVVYDKLSLYTFGYLSGFSEWFISSGYDFNKLSLGKYTFAGIYDLLGIERKAGIYSELTIINANGNTTNIYTFFRMFIDDFGIIGSIIIAFFVGLIAGISYVKVHFQKKIPYIAVLVVFYAQTLYGIISGLLSYNTMILSFSLFGVYLIFSTKSEKELKSEVSISKKRKFERYRITW